MYKKIKDIWSVYQSLYYYIVYVIINSLRNLGLIVSRRRTPQSHVITLNYVIFSNDYWCRCAAVSVSVSCLVSVSASVFHSLRMTWSLSIYICRSLFYIWFHLWCLKFTWIIISWKLDIDQVIYSIYFFYFILYMHRV
jgi:hypothetical protein